MLTEPEFHPIADETLSILADALEDADADGALDCDLLGGVLTVTVPDGRQYVVSKHAPSRQLWAASPVSGGLHFQWTEDGWRLADGRELLALAKQEIGQMAGITCR